MIMAKPEKPKGSRQVGSRETTTARVLQAARAYRAANTASKDVATGKLKELGILSSNGKLSKNYS